ncbi:MAG: GTP cyclohydrolase FolE2 [Phycisphaerales bacterium]|nr:GTP cyclohydrolase FolE2 [Phycisphaerales bacterium]MCK6476921.1 GTP cyclohydrolase FolE2 [Phycisphaerales bacterium]
MPKANGHIQKAARPAKRRRTSGVTAKPQASGTVAPKAMPDVQASSDPRNVAIDRVGVKDVTYPLRLRERDGGEQSTVATVNMYVSLPHHQKGTHMSRFLEVLNDQTKGPLRPDTIVRVARDICNKLHAEEAHFEASFTYFIRKPAPVTGMIGLMDYRVTFECMANHHDDFVMTVSAPATSLCPCSKEISLYGAHNQRCRIEAKVRFDGTLWIEDLVELLESAASSPVFAVLKRPDEKWVTEKAFDNPKFVEDIVRDLALALNREDRITWYSINSENFESIHNHNAYAQITRSKRAIPASG